MTAVAVLGITFTHTPHPPLKRMKNVVKKQNWVLPNVTSKIRTKSIRPMVCALNNCFCRQKAKMNFTQSMGFSEGLYVITITLDIAQLSCRCYETGLIPVLLYLLMIIMSI